MERSINPEDLREHAGEATRLLKALANHQRLMILCLLADQDMNVSELNDRLDLSQSALSQHLAVLRRDGLVTTRRDAQSITYSVVDGAAKNILHVLHDSFCGQSTNGACET